MFCSQSNVGFESPKVSCLAKDILGRFQFYDTHGTKGTCRFGIQLFCLKGLRNLKMLEQFVSVRNLTMNRCPWSHCIWIKSFLKEWTNPCLTNTRLLSYWYERMGICLQSSTATRLGIRPRTKRTSLLFGDPWTSNPKPNGKPNDLRPDAKMDRTNRYTTRNSQVEPNRKLNLPQWLP